MPFNQTNVVLDETTPFDLTTGAIKFSYASPEEATAQQDILFTSNLRTSENQQGETITFYHALTGVKFANYFNNDTTIPDNKTETLIKEVTISGLKDEGSCIVTPSADASVKSATAVVWDPESLTGSATFSQSYAEAFATYGSTYKLDAKLNTTAATHNLNDENGTLTFWFIPQTLGSDVKIKVKFDIRVNGGITFENQELEVSLGDILTEGGHNVWSAGELHTFTLRPEKVGVRIDDNMASATVKNNLRFTNTGNVDQYVRVYIIGNWVGKRVIDGNGNTSAESILMGYKTADLTDHREVERWNDKDFTWQGGTVGGTKVFRKWYSPGNPDGYDYVPYGEFEGLPEMGTSSAPGADNGKNWLRHDKFYYYTESIGPGHDLPSTNPLFTSYTITTVP
ncbi:MAG: fimbrillin family protein, partial [Bacteroidales bacterium]|nr:fimbrillin family protein [Bacteroidales bacterium]